MRLHPRHYYAISPISSSFFFKVFQRSIFHLKLSTRQIGCYFGAELCSVDVNSDGNTDFLLVGAPLFYQPQEKREGQIHVYRLTEQVDFLSG